MPEPTNDLPSFLRLVSCVLLFSLAGGSLHAGIIVTGRLSAYAQADGVSDLQVRPFSSGPGTLLAEAINGSIATSNLAVTEAFFDGSALRFAFDADSYGVHVPPSGWINGESRFFFEIETTTPTILQYSLEGIGFNNGASSGFEFGRQVQLGGNFNETGSRLLQPGTYQVLGYASWSIEPRRDDFFYSSANLAGSFQLRPVIDPVPEPSTLAIFGIGAMSLMGIRQRKRAKESTKTSIESST